MAKSARWIGITLMAIVTSVASLPAVADALSASDIVRAIAVADRTPGDNARDEGRNPGEVLAFLGLAPGMQVMDVMAAAGWYTEVLALSLKGTGTVYAQNLPDVLRMRDGANDKAMTARLAAGRLPNVVRLDRDFHELGLANAIDLAITALNLHDLYNRDPETALAMLLALKATLKPGGVLGVIDHNGAPGADNTKLHRMTAQQAIDLAVQAGFTVESSDVLHNPDDDLTKMVFDPALRGHTDRFVLKLTKPVE